MSASTRQYLGKDATYSDLISDEAREASSEGPSLREAWHDLSLLMDAVGLDSMPMDQSAMAMRSKTIDEMMGELVEMVEEGCIPEEAAAGLKDLIEPRVRDTKWVLYRWTQHMSGNWTWVPFDTFSSPDAGLNALNYWREENPTMLYVLLEEISTRERKVRS